MTTPKWENKVGRPRLYNTPEEFQTKCDEYFALCDQTEKPYTVPGLAYHLGFEHRNVFNQYGRDYPEFKGTVSRARARIEAQRAGQLIEREGSTQGLQFDLKNNFGYFDRQEIDVSGKISISGDLEKKLNDAMQQAEGRPDVDQKSE